MPFKPGQSGNPAGRSKSAASLAALARKHCKRALQLCANYMVDEEASANIRLTAAGMLLDRGLGKPAQGTTAQALSDEELVAELMLRKKIRDAVSERTRASGGQGTTQ